ncbi:protein kinase domain-containing protein [Pedosphaera parvula]|uniref:Serine/threonine protein kinase n=1 Tax=Pedosphaera parvula (strain Ellin514) TaxID=320771 RepID=B9XAQ6_PEDPL|nr:tetratricopeptide repeat protein [Pedosphaera parvula]EEF63091.1 serine/threonine protein kinase [Pedosphaera parvula Ellin514]
MPESSDHEFTIFSAARQLPPGERASFFDKVCAGDDAMRQRVEELLQAGEKAAAAFMETPAADLSKSSSASRPAVVRAENPGDWIGRYKLLEQIGEGGCGIVYLAQQEEPVRRRVALKVIKLGMDTKSVIARFEAERQALALMDHPNIAKVLDAGATSAGRLYFVMELVPGVKITDCCDQNNLSTRDRLELFMQVCHAIQHAHQKGIIHRDIKPSNILVTMNDGVPFPKVIDFGIAKATHGKLTDQTFFTAFEQFIGTPAYMSPEQAEAGGLDVDTRTDIYSLGVLLYELLTGQTPFNSKELLQIGLDEIRRTIREREPATPSTCLSTMQGDALATIAKHRKAEALKLIHLVRGDLDWIVMKALEKDRARRYETANDLAADIRRHLSNEAVVARPPSTAYRFQKLVRRNKLVFAATGAIAAALAMGVALSVWSSIKEHQARLEAEKERRQAQTNEQKAQVEAAKSRQVAQFLEDMLDGVGPSVAMGSDTTLLKRILDNTAKRIGSDLAQQPEVEAELRYTLGEVYWELGDLENAQAMHERALSLRIKELGGKNPLVAQSMRRLGHVLWRQGFLDKAEKMARAGVALQRELYGNKNLEVARSLEDLAAILNTKNLSTTVEATLREAVTTKEALLGDNNLEMADSLDNLAAWLFSRRYKRPEAAALSRKAIAIRRKLLGPDNPLVTIASLKLESNELDIQGKSNEQEATLYKLVAEQRKILGNEHPSLAQSLNLLASVLKNEGKLAESEPIQREALSMQRKLLGEENPEVAKSEASLGELLIAGNRLSEAELMYRSALTIRRKVFGPNSTLAGESLVNLGQLLEKENKLEDARNLYLEGASGVSDFALTAQDCLGMLYVRSKDGLNDPTEGAKWLRKSAEHGNSRAKIDLAILYFDGTGVPKDEVEALNWFHKAAQQGNSQAMKTLADCYCAAGRSQEAIATLRQVSGSRPKDMDLSLTLATWQAWFKNDVDYESTRQHVVQQAAGTDDAPTAQGAAKAYCLLHSTNAVMLTKALDLARRGVELRKGTPFLPWYQLCLGMAEYRSGQYANAEQTLAEAEQSAGKYPDLPGTARLFRAMSLFRQGQSEKARAVFSEAEAQMPPFPLEESKPIIEGKTASHNVMICWLAYKEAKSLLNRTDR